MDPSTEPLPFTLNWSTLLVTGRVDYEEVAIYWMNISCSDGERECHQVGGVTEL